MTTRMPLNGPAGEGLGGQPLVDPLHRPIEAVVVRAHDTSTRNDASTVVCAAVTSGPDNRRVTVEAALLVPLHEHP